jgi:hypothetical protein
MQKFSSITFFEYSPFHEPNHNPEPSDESEHQRKVRETFSNAIKDNSEELKKVFTCKYCKKTPKSLICVFNHLRSCYNTDIECPVCVPENEEHKSRTSKRHFTNLIQKIKMRQSEHHSMLLNRDFISLLLLYYIGKADMLETLN